MDLCAVRLGGLRHFYGPLCLYLLEIIGSSRLVFAANNLTSSGVGEGNSPVVHEVTTGELCRIASLRRHFFDAGPLASGIPPCPEFGRLSGNDVKLRDGGEIDEDRNQVKIGDADMATQQIGAPHD